MYSTGGATSRPRSFSHWSRTSFRIRSKSGETRRIATSPRNIVAAKNSRSGQSGESPRGVWVYWSRRNGWLSARVRARSIEPSARRFQERTSPLVRLAIVSSVAGVRPQLAVLVGVGDRDAGRDHPLDVVGPAVAEVDEVVAAGLGVLDRPLVAAGRGLDQVDPGPLQVGAEDEPLDLEEVEELAVLVQGVDDDLDLPLLAADVERQVPVVDRPHRPADDLRPERRVALPARPGGGPLPAGVGGEGDRPAQAVGPVGQQGRRLLGGQGGDDRDLDQLATPWGWSGPAR